MDWRSDSTTLLSVICPVEGFGWNTSSSMPRRMVMDDPGSRNFTRSPTVVVELVGRWSLSSCSQTDRKIIQQRLSRSFSWWGLTVASTPGERVVGLSEVDGADEGGQGIFQQSIDLSHDCWYAFRVAHQRPRVEQGWLLSASTNSPRARYGIGWVADGRPIARTA